VDRGHQASAVFSKRHNAAGKARRYGGGSGDDLDEDEERRGGLNSSDDDDLDRAGDPLSLEELDGWMNQINGKGGKDQD